ncbi:hypothetical protein [Vibrio phage P23]|nr:hypothetical protein [Vibrio phage P23]
MKAKELVKTISELGGDFDVVVDNTGGYVEIDGITVNFDDNLNIDSTEVSL